MTEEQAAPVDKIVSVAKGAKGGLEKHVMRRRGPPGMGSVGRKNDLAWLLES
jgi:hypothetical protein